MTLTPDAHARIEARIRSLAPRRGADTARQELHSHVAEAAEALAGDQPASSRHVDAAFAALGSDADVQATFFPRRARPSLGKPALGLLVLSTALAALAVLGDDGGRATYSVSAGGSCEASASGDALELLVWCAPPLLVLAALALAPAWIGTLVAALYLVAASLRGISDLTVQGPSWGLLLPLAGLVSIAVAGRQLKLERAKVVVDAS